VFLLSGVYGFEISLTNKELNAALKPEFNQSFYYCFAGEFAGSLEFNNLLDLGGGVSLGQTGDSFEINAFASAEFIFPLPWFLPLSVNAAYVYMGLPAWHTNVHTLMPLISLRYKWAGVSLGPAFRFTQFNHSRFYEPKPAFLVYINFYNTEKARIGLSVGTFSNFEVNNTGAYSIRVYDQLPVTGNLSLFHEVELPMSGSIAHVISACGLAFRAGVAYRW
jgi:hypothetical protein